MPSLISILLVVFLIPAAHAADPLDLDDALRATSQRNPSLAAAELEVRQAQAQLHQARGLVLPMAQAGASWTHMDHEEPRAAQPAGQRRAACPGPGACHLAVGGPAGRHHGGRRRRRRTRG